MQMDSVDRGKLLCNTREIKNEEIDAKGSMEDLKLYKERYMKQKLLSDVVDISDIVNVLKEDGSWEDVAYAPYGNGLNHPTRIVSMAKAYANPSSSQYQDKSLLDKITLALNYWTKKDLRFANWYPNVIEVPQRLIDTLLLVGDVLPDTTREAVLKAVNREVKANPADEKSVAANLVWIVKNTIRLALYKNDPELLVKAFDRIGKETVMVTQLKDEIGWRNASWRSYVGIDLRDPAIEGIQVDYSCLTHGPLLYTGGYGMAFIDELAEIIYNARDTNLYPESPKKVFSDHILEHVRWVVRGKTFDYSTMGRNFANNNASATSDNAKRLRSGLEYLCNTPGIPRKEEMEEFAKKMDGLDTDISKTDSVSGRGEAKSPVIGNRSFWKADYMTHHTEKFFVSVRMSSNRTLAAEIVNWENLKGDYLADGVTYLYRTGEEYDDIFCVWDWAKIPGATIAQKPFKPVTKQHVAIPGSKTDFAGSVSDGKYGAAAMQLVRDALSAKKAWFMFDKEFVALGTDINGSTANKVVTSVNQSLLVGEVTISDGNGITVLEKGTHIPNKLKWIHHDSTGYIFNDVASVTIKNEKQSGDRNAISGMNPEKINRVHKDVFSVWFDHDNNLSGQDYQYIVVPGITKEELNEYGMSDRIKVVSNTSSTQAVWNESLNMLQTVFWQPGTSITPGGLTVEIDQASLLILQKEGGKMKFTLSNPMSKPMMVNVTVNIKLLGDGITYDEGKGTSTITVQLPGEDYAGQSVTLSFDSI